MLGCLFQLQGFRTLLDSSMRAVFEVQIQFIHFYVNVKCVNVTTAITWLIRLLSFLQRCKKGEAE